MDVDPRTLSAAEAQAHGVAGSSASNPGPAPWPTTPALPQYNVATPAPAPRPTEFASLSPEIEAARDKAEAVRQALSSQGAGVEGPTNTDIMAKLDKMSESMALKDDVRTAQIETCESMRKFISDEFVTRDQQIGNMNERLETVEQADTLRDQRITILENNFKEAHPA